MNADGPTDTALLTTVDYFLYYLHIDDFDTPLRLAELIADDDSGMRPIERYQDALRSALASDNDLSTDEHSDAAVRSLYQRLLEVLGTPQPWEQPAVRRVDMWRSRQLFLAPVIGTIALPTTAVGQVLGRTFDRATLHGTKSEILVLALATGESLALRADRGSPVVEVRSLHDPAATLSDFERLTGITVSR